MIEWDTKYAVGIPKIDTQHMALVALINRMEAVQSHPGTAPRDIAESLKHLVEYIRVHFAQEEEMMSKFKYDEFEKHCLQHKGFVKHVEGFQERFEGGETDLALPILHFLTDWLLTHISRSDRGYVEYFEKTGVIEAVRAD